MDADHVTAWSKGALLILAIARCFARHIIGQREIYRRNFLNYKRQEIKYNHYLFKEKFLIGVSKEISKEEASLFINNPILMYERNVYGKIMQLERKNREHIMNALEKWEKVINREDSFVGLYWDIVLDCILAVYGMSTLDLANKMKKMSYFNDCDEKIVTKNIFDNLEKMRSNKKTIRDQGQELITKICYCCKITEDIVQTGEGIMYYVKSGKDYTTEQVDAYCNNHNTVILKDMIADITGVKRNEIIEIPMQIAIKRKRMEDKIYDFLDIILDEMIKK